MVGILEDKDRIFTNVYGFQPWNLKSAQMRGDWDNTKKLMEIGQDAIIEEIKASLRDIAKADVDVDLVIDPSLIGGLVVKMGSRMVDASLKTKLNGIRLAMLAAR